MIRCLIQECGADVHKADIRGCSPVFTAIEHEKMAAARCLISEFGGDVNQATLDGFTPQLRSLIESSRIGNNVG
jgi:hypothetical protein